MFLRNSSSIGLRTLISTFKKSIERRNQFISTSAAKKSQLLRFLPENYSGSTSFTPEQEAKDTTPIDDQIFKYACESEEKFRRISAIIPACTIEFHYHTLWENYYSETKETFRQIAEEKGPDLVKQGVMTEKTLNKLLPKRKLLESYYFVGSTDSVSSIDVHAEGEKAFVDYCFEDEVAYFADYDPDSMTHDQKLALLIKRPELIDEMGGLLQCHSFCLKVTLSRQIKPVEGKYFVSKLHVV